MKAILSLFSILLVFLTVLTVGVMMLTNPTPEDFGKFIVNNYEPVSNVAVLGEEEVLAETTVQDYKIFSIFTYNGERYMGLLSEIASEDAITEELNEE